MRTAWVVLLAIILVTSADAAVLCARLRAGGTFSSGLAIRETCKRNETQVNPSALGLQGPPGPPGMGVSLVCTQRPANSSPNPAFAGDGHAFCAQWSEACIVKQSSAVAAGGALTTVAARLTATIASCAAGDAWHNDARADGDSGVSEFAPPFRFGVP